MKFYSEVLNKVFDTEEALTQAEAAAESAAAEKKAKAEAKKAEATKVEDAYKARNDAKRAYNAKIADLRKKYNADMLNLRKAFDNSVAEAKTELATADNNYNTALNEFIKQYPEGYHMTLKNGDNVVAIDAMNTTDIRRLERLLADREKWFSDVFNEFFMI